MNVAIRGYRPVDHAFCRDLWAEMVATQRRQYKDDTIGGKDPGSGFEEYLTRLNLSGMWVAEAESGDVVGLAGLLIDGRDGLVDPLVVSEEDRDEGIGQQLLDRVGEEASRRGLSHLRIKPETRNLAALHCAHDAGYTIMTQVVLTKEIRRSDRDWTDGLEMHGLRFRY